MTKWKTLSTKLIHENPFMRLMSYDVIRTNGHRAPIYVLERPQPSAIIALTPDKEIYLVGQFRYTVSAYSWEFPIGAVKGENPLTTAKQELREEVGITAESWTKIGKVWVAPGHSNIILSVFLAQKIHIAETDPEPGEILTVKKVSLAKLEDMIAEGEILDGPTISAFHLLEVYLKKHT